MIGHSMALFAWARVLLDPSWSLPAFEPPTDPWTSDLEPARPWDVPEAWPARGWRDRFPHAAVRVVPQLGLGGHLLIAAFSAGVEVWVLERLALGLRGGWTGAFDLDARTDVWSVAPEVALRVGGPDAYLRLSWAAGYAHVTTTERPFLSDLDDEVTERRGGLMLAWSAAVLWHGRWLEMGPSVTFELVRGDRYLLFGIVVGAAGR